MEILVVGAIRVAGSLPVLRWAFVGGLIAVFVDLSDLFWRQLLDLGGIPNYQGFDKYADLVYLVAFALVTTGWAGPARRIALALFAYRMVGVAAFEAGAGRTVLLFFPNLFEFWFLFVASLPHWRPGFDFNRSAVLRWLAFLLALKLFQEYALHGAQWLDGGTPTEALESVWDWITGPLR